MPIQTKHFRQTMWQARHAVEARKSVLPAWETYSIPLLDTAAASFDAARIGDLALDPVESGGEVLPLGVIRTSCGHARKYIPVDGHPLLTFKELMEITDEIAPPLGITFNDCQSEVIVALDAGQFGIYDEMFDLALCFHYAAGTRSCGSSIFYSLFRRTGRETLVFELAGVKSPLYISASSNVSRISQSGLRDLFEARERVVLELEDSLVKMAEASPTAWQTEKILDELWPVKTAPGRMKRPKGEALKDGQKEEVHEYTQHLHRQWIRGAFVKMESPWIDTDASFGTMLGLWFTIAEIENFKFASQLGAAARQVLVGDRAKRIRGAWTTILNQIG